MVLFLPFDVGVLDGLVPSVRNAYVPSGIGLVGVQDLIEVL